MWQTDIQTGGWTDRLSDSKYPASLRCATKKNLNEKRWVNRKTIRFYEVSAVDELEKNYKMWQLWMHCNLRPLDFALYLFRFYYDAMPNLKSMNPPNIAVLLLIHYFTLWTWPLTLNICSVLPVTLWNSVPNLNAIEQSAAKLLRFPYLTNWSWTCVMYSAQLWDNSPSLTFDNLSVPEL